MLNERHSEILALLLSKGQTSVQEITQSLGASLATVRRDLIELENIGRIQRQHGSARIAAVARKEVAFSARERNNLSAKRTIAVCAAAYLKPNEAIFLDAGTTVLQLARHIRSADIELRVFTNGLAVAHELAHVPKIDLTLIGGKIRHENLSTIGPLANAMLQDLWFDQLFLGTTAIDHDCNLTSLDVEEAAANALMIQRSRSVTVMADSSKFNDRSTHLVSQMAAGQTLISERAPVGQFADNIKRCGVKFELAQTNIGRVVSNAN
jgi:DeoR family transcriptional regulator of aga operon